MHSFKHEMWGGKGATHYPRECQLLGDRCVVRSWGHVNEEGLLASRGHGIGAVLAGAARNDKLQGLHSQCQDGVAKQAAG